MKTFLALILLLALAASVSPQHIPQDHTYVDKDQIEKESIPFLGIWDSVSCQDKAYGLRFTVDAGQGEDTRPQFSIEQFYPPLQVKHIPFDTDAFTKITSGEEPMVWLDVTNGSLLLTLYPQKNGTIYGTVLTNADNDWVIAAARATGSLEDFYKKNAGLCGNDKALDKFFKDEQKRGLTPADAKLLYARQ